MADFPEKSENTGQIIELKQREFIDPDKEPGEFHGFWHLVKIHTGDPDQPGIPLFLRLIDIIVSENISSSEKLKVMKEELMKEEFGMQLSEKFENEIDLSNSIGMRIADKAEIKTHARDAMKHMKKSGASLEAAMDYFDIPENQRQAVADYCKQYLDEQSSSK